LLHIYTQELSSVSLVDAMVVENTADTVSVVSNITTGATIANNPFRLRRTLISDRDNLTARRNDIQSRINDVQANIDNLTREINSHPVVEPVITTKGTPCKNCVKAGGRCSQHRL
jgi:hypothetical protein